VALKTASIATHPTADWVVQQLREAFPEASPYRYVILDRDSKFDAEVIAFLKATGLKQKRTSVQAPGQNGIAERWVGSVRGWESWCAANEISSTTSRKKLRSFGR
jgi:hypothetical protein